MRFMLLLYDNADTREVFFRDSDAVKEVMAVIEELTRSGELISTDPLADPAQTKTVRASAGGGAPVITDGPLAESKEHFGGYLIVDCESVERAVEIAVSWPSVRWAPLEVRPIMEVGGVEM